MDSSVILPDEQIGEANTIERQVVKSWKYPRVNWRTHYVGRAI